LVFEVNWTKINITVTFYAKLVLIITRGNHGSSVLKLGRLVSHDKKMTPIDLEVNMSKVKVTVTFNARKNLFDQ
jgi:hypothetical protein